MAGEENGEDFAATRREELRRREKVRGPFRMVLTFGFHYVFPIS
jgi:hypothetical protein